MRKENAMAFVGHLTRDEIAVLEKRTREIIAGWNREGGRRGRVGCSCYHPQDTGIPQHAPDCAGIVASDEQYEAAWEQAEDELDALKGD